MTRTKGRIDDNGRECSECRTWKPWSEFSPCSRASTGHLSACKTCRNARAVRQSNINRESWRKQKREKQRERRKIAGYPSPEESHAEMVRRWEIGPEGRICRICESWKPWPEFYRRPDDAGKYLARCKSCYATLGVDLKYAKFGMTSQQYANLARAQDYCCALCGNPERRQDHRSGRIWRLSIDHDHSCLDHSAEEGCIKCVRGLVCSNCNFLIGKAEHIGGSVAARFTDYLARRPLLLTH